MPRHPPIALTSRLRIHTTNDRFGTRSSLGRRTHPRGLAGLERHPSHPGTSPGHSQLDNHLVYGTCISRPPAEAVVMEEAHAATASISRTHSQCQRGACAPRIRGPWPTKIWSSYLEKGDATRTPSVAASCALWRASRRWPTLPPVRNSCATSSLRLQPGGAYRDRTDDLKLAKLALSQLS
jgi:hypothetical protein